MTPWEGRKLLLKIRFLKKVGAACRGVYERYGVNWRAGRGAAPWRWLAEKFLTPLWTPLASALPAKWGWLALAIRLFRSPVVKRSFKALAKALAGWGDKIIFRKVKELSGTTPSPKKP